MINKNYGKLTSPNSIQYAPRSFRENDSLVIPRIDDDQAYFARGWYKVVNVKPQYDAVTQTIYVKQWITNESEKTITAEYIINPRLVDTRKKAKKYSKLRMTLFCMEHGIWNDVKDFLEKIGYYDLFVMAQYFLDTDDYFQRGIAMFKDSYADVNHPKEEIETLVKTMLNFAFDGYEIINEDADEEDLDVSTTTDNVGL